MIITALLIAACALLISAPKPLARGGLCTGKRGKSLRIRAGPKKLRSADPVDVSADIELFSACLDAGLSTRDAAQVVAHVAAQSHRETWSQVVALLSIGVSAPQAFSLMAAIDGLDELANLATVSYRSGSALSEGCKNIATSLRATAGDKRTAAAERAGVFIALPLALCFLPAFMIVGLAPVVLSLGTQLINF
ncbi:type II secretion system F domain-containing protein [Corynebacterium suranareeae]|uniref:Type II secretion system F domain-containing protein n=1 Tax=Corynebacterium suranareeae TaxID=2506452 RepID=A0A169RP68_9CORY|nr:type II secretion system F family protein [Corynebacterium suranareeae]BAU94692.1 type II secretion system F domain-containing protein [Corynebacterium suranareeae]